MKILVLLSNFFYFERLGFLYAVTPLIEKNHTIKCILPQNMSFDQLVEKIKDYAPDIIAYSVSTGEHNYFINLNQKLKQYCSFFSLFGGPHPTYFPEMIKNEGVDAACIGEADGALLEFVSKFYEKENILNVKNFWVKRDNQIFKNIARDLIMNLDQIPFPQRKILYDCDPRLESFYMKMFLAARGCPRNCTFCYNHKFKDIYPTDGMKLRYRSVENLIEEISLIRERYPLDFIAFGDDNFIFKPKDWLETFSELYRNKINIPFQCSISANLVDNFTLSVLKKSNCYSVSMALECGDEYVNNKILKKGIKNDQFIKAVILLKEHGIKVRTLNIVALPVPDPILTDFRTLGVNLRCKPDVALSTPLIPFPKLEITDYCKNNGYITDEKIYELFKTNPNEYSFLNFGSKKILKKLMRLNKLFPLIIAFPFLRFFLNLLITLPLFTIYKYINLLYFAYTIHIKLTPQKSYLKTFKMAPDFFSYLINREKY